jgi:hypothetical protein
MARSFIYLFLIFILSCSSDNKSVNKRIALAKKTVSIRRPSTVEYTSFLSMDMNADLSHARAIKCLMIDSKDTVDSNFITKFSRFSNLNALHVFDKSANELEIIFKAISNNKSIKSLYISNSKIDFDGNINTIHNLSSLTLRFNGLFEFPTKVIHKLNLDSLLIIEKGIHFAGKTNTNKSLHYLFIQGFDQSSFNLDSYKLFSIETIVIHNSFVKRINYNVSSYQRLREIEITDSPLSKDSSAINSLRKALDKNKGVLVTEIGQLNFI